MKNSAMFFSGWNKELDCWVDGYLINNKYILMDNPHITKDCCSDDKCDCKDPRRIFKEYRLFEIDPNSVKQVKILKARAR